MNTNRDIDRLRSGRAGDEAVPSALLDLGRAYEQSGAFDEAVRCHDRAIEILEEHARTNADASVRRELAVAWMNRGNALQHRTAREFLVAAVAAYDCAIELLGSCASSHAVLNHLGAAWLNRSCALEQLADPDSLAAALDSADRAILILRSRPLDADVNHRVNLAGALLGRANALLRSGDAARCDPAGAAARAALDIVAPVGRDNVFAAEVAIKASRACLAATAATKQEFASDLVDDGLDLARDWIERGAAHLQPLAFDFFQVGALLYAERQPQFLAEFIDEAFAHSALSGGHDALRAITSEAIAQAESGLRRRWLQPAASEPMLPLLEILAELSALRSRCLLSA